MPTLQNETRIELTGERHAQPPALPLPPDQERQRKRMLIALGVLLIALVAVVVKDWDFWFPSGDEGEYSFSRTKKKVVAAATPTPVKATAPAGSDRKASKNPSTPEAPFTASTERAALPPLQVEVVAGNQRRTVPAKSNAIHLDLGVEGTAAGASDASANRGDAVVSAADRVQLSPQTAQNVTVSVPPNYPVLARQMKVQGAVVLQAMISREGAIQELQVLNGPGILAAAAREAVKQWRFKPYYVNGQPVETQARITVNFTISTN